MDGIENSELVLAIVIGFAALGAFVVLRVIAVYREHEVERHDLAREARRLRAEYERKVRGDTDTSA